MPSSPRAGFLASATLLAWCGKLAVWKTANAASPVFWFGFALSVALGACAVSALRAAVREDAAKFRVRRTLVAALAFTALAGFPFAFDIHAAAKHETRSAVVSLAFTCGSFALGVALLGGVRFFALVCVRSARLRFVFPYLAFAAFESLTLAFAPLAYFSALPAPVPVARPWEEGEAARIPLGARASRTLAVFVDPRTDDAQRLALSAKAPEDIAALLSERVDLALAAKSGPWRRIVVFFPETFLNLEAAEFRAFRPRFAEGLTASVVPGGSIEVFLGARAGAANVVFRGFDDPRLGRPLGGVAHAKAGLVPFFETPVFGWSLRPGDETAALMDAGDEGLALSSEGLLDFGVSPDQPALVCYEALSPLRWKFGGDALVLTNHAAFAEPGLASASYDLTLRLLARILGSSAFLAANQGTSGIFGEPRGLGLSTGLAHVELEGIGGL